MRWHMSPEPRSASDQCVIDVVREALLLVRIALEVLAEPFSMQAISGEGLQTVGARSVKKFYACAPC